RPLSLCARAAPAARAGAPVGDPAARRGPPAGEVAGFTGAYGSHVWLGLPYAAPPVGALRWRAPQPAPRWEGVREAVFTGEPCPHDASVYAGSPRGTRGGIGPGDCLPPGVRAPRLHP